MADTDLLPARGVPALALVDSTGIASNGSQTVAQLAARGIRSVCAVDANGISLSGASVAQLASSGIRAFCPVDENGLAQDAVSTADILRRRGIRPMVLLNNTGVALTGSANVATLAQRGLQSFCPVDEAGNATTMGAVILVSNTTVLDTATIGSTVGTLSVAGGTGTYTFTLTSNPGSLFATAGANGVNLNVAAALTAGIKPITVQAAGGVPTPISRTINITVASSGAAPVNTALPVITGAVVVGSLLSTTPGTWTGAPTPGYTYQWQRGVPDVAPVNTVPPASAGSLSVGSTLTLSDGTWTGTAPITYTRQWKRDGVNISGATASTYVLVSGDLGKMISATVTATNAAGNASANAAAVGPITSAGDPHVDAWKNAVVVAGGTVSGARETAVTNFVTTLKGGLNVWAKLQRYWLVAGENAGAAKVDIKAQGLLTISGTPVFTANKGYVTSALNNVDTDFDPTVAAGAFTTNSAMFGGFVNTPRNTGTVLLDFGAANGPFTIICTLNTYEGTYAIGRINSSGPSVGNDHTHTSRGQWIVSRTGANADALYYNGSSAGYPNGGGTGTDAAAGMPNCVFALGCVNQMGSHSNHSGSQISSFFAGGGLNAAEALELYNAEVTLLTAIGVLP